MDLTIPCVLSLLGWSLLTAKVQVLAELTDHVCTSDSNLCYYLYKEESALGLSEAVQECSKREQSLATLLDTKSQSLLTEMDYNEEDELAWVSATISNDSTWQTVDGQNVTNISYEQGTGYRCSAYRGFEDHFTFFASPCKLQAKSSFKLPVCQISPEKGSCPNNSTLLVGDTCYAILPNWTNNAFEAFTICSHIYPDSTLAYRHIDNNDFRQFVLEKVVSFNSMVEVWMGVFSKPWVWVLNSSDSVQMQTTNWQTGYGMEEHGSCLSINLKNDKTWQNIDCSGKLHRYLCQVSKDDVSSTNGPTTSSTNTNIIVGIIFAAIFILIILIAAVIVLLRRRTKRRKSLYSDNGLREGKVGSNLSFRNSELTSETDKTNRNLDLVDVNLAMNSTRFKNYTSNNTIEEIFMPANN